MSKEVQGMFASIATRYDRANDVLSFGVHRLWRKTAIRELGAIQGQTAVDLCTGTGDLAFALADAVGPQGRVIALDFVEEMLELAREKQEQQQPSATIEFRHGDAMATGLSDGVAQVVTVAFGIRNVDDPRRCLVEMRRLLRSGGQALVLEFGQPTLPGFAQLFKWYGRWIMPRLGGLVTGNPSAYEYLPKTSWAFPSGDAFAALMQEAGFSRVKVRPLFFGVAYLYLGTKE